MQDKLLETIQNNKIILIIDENNLNKNLEEKLKKNLLFYIIKPIDITETDTIENLSPDKKYLFIFNGFGEDGKFENIFIRYQLSKYNHAKIVIICRAALIAHYRDPSLYFVPIKNNQLQKKHFAIYQMDSHNEENIRLRQSTLFLRKENPIINEKKSIALKSMNHYLNQKIMTQDSAMMQNLADRIKESEVYKKFLFQLIYNSRESNNMQVAAANAITGLNYAKIAFSGMDLSRIKIPHANLNNSILNNTIFSYSNLSKINFANACMLGMDANSSNMSGCKFYEKPCMAFSMGAIKHVVYSWNENYIYFSEKAFQARSNSELSQKFRLLTENKPLSEFFQDIKKLENPSKNTQANKSILYQFNVLTKEIVHQIPINGDIFSIAEHPQGQLLAFSTNTIYLWNLRKNNQIILEKNDYAVSVLQFSRDGNLLFSGDANGYISIWDVNKHQLVKKIGKYGFIKDLKIHTHNHYFVFIESGLLHLYDYLNLTQIKTIKITDGFLSHLCFSPSGDMLSVVSKNLGEEKLIIIRVNDFVIEKEMDVSEVTRSISANIYSSSEKIIFLADENGIISCWNIEENVLLNIYRGHKGAISNLSLNHNGDLMISSGEDKTIHFWEIPQNLLQQKNIYHISGTQCVAISNNGHYVASGGVDSSIHLRDIFTGRVLRSVKFNSGSITALCFDPQTIKLILNTLDNSLYSLDIRTGEVTLLQKQSVSQSSAFTIGFSNVENNKNLLLLENTFPHKKLRSAAIKLTALRLYAARNKSESEKEKIKKLLPNSSNASLRQKMLSEKNRMDLSYTISAEISPNGEFIASPNEHFSYFWLDINSERKERMQIYESLPECSHHDLIILDALNNNVIKILSGHTAKIFSICFSRDSELVASSDKNGYLKIWNISTGSLINTLTMSNGNITALSFSPDSQYIIIGTEDNVLTILNYHENTFDLILKGYLDKITSIKVLNDGDNNFLLITGSEDGSVKTWRISRNNNMLQGNLLWSSFSHLSCDGLFLNNTSGLSVEQHELLKQRGACGKISNLSKETEIFDEYEMNKKKSLGSTNFHI